jgi:hypothetical protein
VAVPELDVTSTFVTRIVEAYTMRCIRWPAAGLLVVLVGSTNVGRADEKALEKVPKAVQMAVKSKYAGAEILGAAEEKADGKISYEVYMKMNGKGLDVTFSTTGAVEVVEKEIEAKDLPKQIMATIEKKYQKPKFTKVEEISKAKDGKMVIDVYEILFTTPANKTIEMIFSADGKVNADVDKTPAKDGKSGKSKG